MFQVEIIYKKIYNRSMFLFNLKKENSNMKKNLITVIILFALLFTACDSLWQINNGASVSFNINLEEILKDSTNPFEIGVDASQPSVIQNLSVFPGSQPGDDFTGDDLTVTVTLHNSQNDAIIANQTLTAAQARNTNVVFDQLTAGQTVYAKIEVLFSDEYTEQRGDRDPLYFGARSENAVLKIAENVLAARTNAVFVTPGGMDSTGFTPFNTVSTIEKAVEVLGGVGNFLPGATVYVDGTFNISKDTTWNYPGLTILNNSSKSIVRAGVGADVSAKIEFNGITFRGNPNIAATESMFWVDNAEVHFINTSITGFNSNLGELGAVRVASSGFVSFEGLVTISNNVSGGTPKNVVFNLLDDDPFIKLGVLGQLDPASKIYLNPIIDIASDNIVLVINEGGTFTKDNFVVSNYETEIDAGGSLIVKMEDIPSSETGTITFMAKLPDSDIPFPLPENSLNELKPMLGLPSVGIMWGGANTGYAHIATVTKEALLGDFSSIEDYLVDLQESIKQTLESTGDYTVTTSQNGDHLTVTIVVPQTGAIFLMIHEPDSVTPTPFPEDGLEVVIPMLGLPEAGITWGTTAEDAHIALVTKEALLGDFATIADYLAYLQVSIKESLESSGDVTVRTAIDDSGTVLTIILSPIEEILPEAGTIEFYEMNARGVRSTLSDDIISADGAVLPGYLTQVKEFIPNGDWGTNGNEHIVTVNTGFSEYVAGIEGLALEQGYIAEAVLDQTGENTLLVTFVYEGQVKFLNADGSPITQGLESFGFPGTWGEGNESHILTIVGQDILDFVEYVKTAPDSEYNTEAKEYIAGLNLPSYSMTNYLNSWVKQIVEENLSGIPVGITQKGNVLTVQIMPTIPTSAIADNNIAPAGFETSGTWAIVDGELPQSANATVTVKSGTTYEQISQAIQAEISIPNVTTTSAYYVSYNTSGEVTEQTNSKAEFLINVEAANGYAFESFGGSIRLNFTVELEAAPEIGTIVFNDESGTALQEGSDILTELKLVYKYTFPSPDYDWGTGAEAHIVTVNESAMNGSGFASMTEYLNYLVENDMSVESRFYDFFGVTATDNVLECDVSYYSEPEPPNATIIFYKNSVRYSLTSEDSTAISDAFANDPNSTGKELGVEYGYWTGSFISYVADIMTGFGDGDGFINYFESLFLNAPFKYTTEKAGTLLVVTIP